MALERRLIGWLLGLSLVGAVPAWPQDWAVVASRVKDAVVPILSTGPSQDRPELLCTGVVVAPMRVITERHCLVRDDKEWPVWVGHIEGRVIKEQGDVMLIALDALPEGRVPLHVADRRPKMGEPVAAFGYAFGAPVLTMTLGIVATDVTPAAPKHHGDELWFNLEVIGGMSGGPIVNAQGQLISLNRGARTDGWGSPNALAYGAGWSSLYRLIALWR